MANKIAGSEIAYQDLHGLFRQAGRKGIIAISDLKQWTFLSGGREPEMNFAFSLVIAYARVCLVDHEPQKPIIQVLEKTAMASTG